MCSEQTSRLEPSDQVGIRSALDDFTRLLGFIQTDQESPEQSRSMQLCDAHTNAMRVIFDDSETDRETLASAVLELFSWGSIYEPATFDHPVNKALVANAVKTGEAGAGAQLWRSDYSKAVAKVMPLVMDVYRAGAEALPDTGPAIDPQDKGEFALSPYQLSQMLQAPCSHREALVPQYSTPSGPAARLPSSRSAVLPRARGSMLGNGYESVGSVPRSRTLPVISSLGSATGTTWMAGGGGSGSDVSEYADCSSLYETLVSDLEKEPTICGICFISAPGPLNSDMYHKPATCSKKILIEEVFDALLIKDGNNAMVIKLANYTACFRCLKPYNAAERRKGCPDELSHEFIHKALLGAVLYFSFEDFRAAARQIRCPDTLDPEKPCGFANWLGSPNVMPWLGQKSKQLGFTNLHHALFLVLRDNFGKRLEELKRFRQTSLSADPPSHWSLSGLQSG
jgi:hypothetical protein